VQHPYAAAYGGGNLFAFGFSTPNLIFQCNSETRRFGEILWVEWSLHPPA
jgi:hypothetical protein